MDAATGYGYALPKCQRNWKIATELQAFRPQFSHEFSRLRANWKGEMHRRCDMATRTRPTIRLYAGQRGYITRRCNEPGGNPVEQRRLRAIQMLDVGLSTTEVASRLGVNRSTVIRWVERYHQGHGVAGLKARRPCGRGLPILTDAHLTALAEQIRLWGPPTGRDATRCILGWLKESHGVEISYNGLLAAIHHRRPDLAWWKPG